MCVQYINIIINITTEYLSLSLVLFSAGIIGQNYFSDPWNVLDFIIVLGSIADIIYTELSVSHCSVNFLSAVV